MRPHLHPHCQAWCRWSASLAQVRAGGTLIMRQGLRKRTGGQQVGQAEVPSVCEAEGSGHRPGGGRGLTISSCPWFLLISTR